MYYLRCQTVYRYARPSDLWSITEDMFHNRLHLFHDIMSRVPSQLIKNVSGHVGSEGFMVHRYISKHE